MDTPTLIRTSRLGSKPGGLELFARCVAEAIASARSDVEQQCERVKDADGSLWWDTHDGLFLGDNQDDREFRELLEHQIDLLSDLEEIERHPQHHHWIRFSQEV